MLEYVGRRLLGRGEFGDQYASASRLFGDFVNRFSHPRIPFATRARCQQIPPRALRQRERPSASVSETHGPSRRGCRLRPSLPDGPRPPSATPEAERRLFGLIEELVVWKKDTTKEALLGGQGARSLVALADVLEAGVQPFPV